MADCQGAVEQAWVTGRRRNLMIDLHGYPYFVVDASNQYVARNIEVKSVE